MSSEVICAPQRILGIDALCPQLNVERSNRASTPSSHLLALHPLRADVQFLKVLSQSNESVHSSPVQVHEACGFCLWFAPQLSRLPCPSIPQATSFRFPEYALLVTRIFPIAVLVCQYLTRM